MSFSRLKPTPNTFSFLENPYLEGNDGLLPNGEKQHRVMTLVPLVVCNEKEPLPFYYLGLSSNMADGATQLSNSLWALGISSGLQ